MTTPARTPWVPLDDRTPAERNALCDALDDLLDDAATRRAREAAETARPA